MSVTKTLIESANPWQSQQSEAARLAKKWVKSGLLENINDETERNNLAMMLENQAKQLVVESSTTGTGGTFTPGTGEQWAGVALPLVRKIFGQIASKEFVSIQPMSLPAGLVFFLDFQYGNTKSPFSLGDSLYGTPDNTEGFGNQAAGGLYGAGRFGYTINQFSSSITNATTGALATWNDFNFDSTYSASAASSQYKKLLVPLPSQTDTSAIRAFFISGNILSGSTSLGSYSQSDILQTFNVVTNNTASFLITASIFTSTPGSGSNGVQTALLYYNKKTDFNSRGDFEDASGAGYPNAESTAADSLAIPEINIQLRSETISAKTRKLKAQWTPEFAQDLNAYQNLDAEAELTSMLSEYISLEVDLEILDMLIQNAPIIEYWSAKVGNQLNSSGTAFETNTAGVYYTQMTWFQTIGIKMQKISNEIHRRTLRGGANFLVCSPAVATILESIPGFAADTDGAADTMKYAFGVQKIGSLNSRYKVYKNPYMTENTILMGFRGTQFLETGAVYSPYIPLIMTPLVYDPDTFTPRKGIMTRYAKKMVRPEFYGKLLVSNLNII
jgi:hypothetical protein